MLPVRSRTVVYDTPCFERKRRASLVRSCQSTPRKTTPCFEYSCDACSSIAASPLQGTHHDAQKFSTTGFPRSDARLTVPGLPTRPSLNVGAGPPIFGG